MQQITFQRGHFILRVLDKSSVLEADGEPHFLTYWLKLDKPNDVSGPQSTQLQVEIPTQALKEGVIKLDKVHKNLDSKSDADKCSVNRSHH